ncbi:E7 [Macaca fascicularis papillomavirus 4]|uniref:Protein E7 n=1 Tax=Macaca fascicularis papillomavirus 4 TaxID=471182 RepID=C3PU89_RHPV1|nr:E7 [Macaca fascicularis papillomavirus 4]
MIGPKPTLEDIVLHLEPEPVDLMCHEQFDSSEDEDEDQVDHHNARLEEPECFRIVSDCHRCQNTLRLVVVSTPEEVRVLEELLMGTLEIVCPRCADRV